MSVPAEKGANVQGANTVCYTVVKYICTGSLLQQTGKTVMSETDYRLFIAISTYTWTRPTHFSPSF